jgi:ABC-type glycerol-3-phosphate transport system substrate-binding protein
MNTYLPYTKLGAAFTVNIGAGGLTIFPTMLTQRGTSVYNEELNATNLVSAESIDAFKFWTEFYTEYSLDQDANFYQKFRVGTMPLGITSYTQYLTIKLGAPEIQGKWGIAPIPGIVKEHGTVDNTCSG